VRAPSLISVRGVEAPVDRVYPDEEPGGLDVGATAQSQTGCPEGRQVRKGSRSQNHHRGAYPVPPGEPPSLTLRRRLGLSFGVLTS
jgi:hypothetical protein